MNKGFEPTAHPVLELPSLAEAMDLGEAGFRELMVRREGIIRAEKQDPFKKGWEPPIWRVCDALLGFEWGDQAWARRMREHLGFAKPVDVLLINGGQRGGKSQYAGKRTMRTLLRKERARAWALHSTLPMSKQYQQPIFWSYMPPFLKVKDIKSRTTYIAYKEKTGFSEEQFVLHNSSDCVFKAYEQDVKGIEGGNLDIIWPDELVPPEWVETMELRLAEKHGKMIITFTPVQGYSSTVQLFQDGAEVVQESVNFLAPMDGGEPLPHLALGLTEEELAEVHAAEEQKRASRCPQSRPENCAKWLDNLPGNESTPHPQPLSPIEAERVAPRSPVNLVNAGQPAVPEGRSFETVPRVMKCAGDDKRAVVFFHSSDNPYGNPKEVWNTIRLKADAFKKERFYGFTSRTQTVRFPKFELTSHVVGPESIPKAGTNYMKCDPSSGRNFFMLWFRVTPEQVFVYREWPGDYDIPERGRPGAWALPDGKKKDGKRGPAQQPFGFGNIRYKLEMARLEQWADWVKWNAECGVRSAELSQDEKKIIAGWDETNGAREVIAEREMDSRFASSPKQENDRPSTLLTDFEEINVFFKPAPAGRISEGIQKINDALDYDENRDIDFFNKPRLVISSECSNLIYSLRTWTGEDGEKGASKDPIEVLYWFFTGENPYVGESGETSNTEHSTSNIDGRPQTAGELINRLAQEETEEEEWASY